MHPSYVPETIKRTKVVATNVGDNELVAAITGKKIRVIGFVGTATAAGTIQFESATDGNNLLSGAMGTAAATQITAPENLDGWMETDVAEALNLIVTGAGNAFNGFLTYQEVPG